MSGDPTVHELRTDVETPKPRRLEILPSRFFAQPIVQPVANTILWNVDMPHRLFKYLAVAITVLSAQPIVFTMQVLYACSSTAWHRLCLAAWRDPVNE